MPAATTSAAGENAKFLIVTAFPDVGVCGAASAGVLMAALWTAVP
ncbi:MAG TPA: hypothetical protein VGM10_16915 [Actinocrinis sp.]